MGSFSDMMSVYCSCLSNFLEWMCFGVASFKSEGNEIAEFLTRRPEELVRDTDKMEAWQDQGDTEAATAEPQVGHCTNANTCFLVLSWCKILKEIWETI